MAIATGISALTKNTYGSVFDDVQASITQVNIGLSAPDGGRSAVILTTNTIAAHANAPTTARTIDFSSLLTNSSAQFTLSATGADGVLVAVGGLKYSEGRTLSDLTVSGVTVEGAAISGFALGATANLRATVTCTGTNPISWFTVAFYDGNPAAGGKYLASTVVTNTLAMGTSNYFSQVNVIAPWVVSGVSGPHTIYAVVDPANTSFEVDEANNTASTPAGQELVISYWNQIAFDAGGGSGGEQDAAYTATRGSGYEFGTAFAWNGGTSPLQTVRYGFNGEVTYRFDNLTDQFSYNVDLALYRPDGLAGTFQVLADDEPLNLFVIDPQGGGTVETNLLSLNQGGRGNPVFASAPIPASVLTDGSVRIQVVSPTGVPVSLAYIQISRGARVFLDSGNTGRLANGLLADPDFSLGQRDPLTGITNGFLLTAPGGLSFATGSGTNSLATARFAPGGRVGYRFAGLDAAKTYVVRPTLMGLTGKTHRFEVNGQFASQPVRLGNLPATYSLFVAKSAYQTNRSISFVVVSTDTNGVGIPGDSSVVNVELDEFAGSGVLLSDTDRDGLPDWWELKYSGGLTNLLPQGFARNADTDGDGMTDYEEYLAGTDPSDAASRLHMLTTFERSSGRLSLAWSGLVGRTYALEWAPAVGGPYQVLQTGLAPNADGTLSYPVQTGQARGFFRIRALKTSAF